MKENREQNSRIHIHNFITVFLKIRQKSTCRAIYDFAHPFIVGARQIPCLAGQVAGHLGDARIRFDGSSRRWSYFGAPSHYGKEKKIILLV